MHDEGINPERRDFLNIATVGFGAVGTVFAAVPFVRQMSPDATTRAQSSIEVDVSSIEVGQAVTVLWQSKPVFVRHRTAAEIAEAEDVDVSDLRDPQTDQQRVQQGSANWLVVVGICTHLNCIPTGFSGDYGGWLCNCHGSHYDTSGRIRKGPAPLNLAVPSYEFLSDTILHIG